MRGIFITVEGPDGAGKTSVVKRLETLLKNELGKETVVLTREPGGIPIAEEIRKVILDPKNVEMDARTEALLYAAARRQHLVERIIPALNEGKVILCDRFVDSSLAYQGAGRKIGMEPVLSINEFATEGLLPDLTLYLDVDSDTGLERIRRGRTVDQLDRLDQESAVFHQRVQHAYIKLAEQDPERIVTINARKDLNTVVTECLKTIKGRFF
ncbi:dTMP kinase [Vagococcus xieshaowenii]|uniref:Thymidylate kinase n=1 Tax=Vagococcus xieshaowenii TaxID=2562451 RepID=A0AAJ5EE36_9ENTE|nr:dTMP kinase [Vagococcus xieshaowenii]QCA29094.1 dTMP kinase [Vagococcus xieshaowenii]TFZ40930.1 dTMP kinase [Vagococcus xieshaowenii]